MNCDTTEALLNSAFDGSIEDISLELPNSVKGTKRVIIIKSETDVVGQPNTISASKPQKDSISQEELVLQHLENQIRESATDFHPGIFKQCNSLKQSTSKSNTAQLLGNHGTSKRHKGDPEASLPIDTPLSTLSVFTTCEYTHHTAF